MCIRSYQKCKFIMFGQGEILIHIGLSQWVILGILVHQIYDIIGQ